jgi:hypothetical protein
VWRPSGARRLLLDGFTPLPRGAQATSTQPPSWPGKDPGDVLDYEVDFSAALSGSGDRIQTIDVAITPSAAGDLVLGQVIADGAVAVMWFSGGQAGTTYGVQVAVTTVGGRTIGRGVLLPVQALAGAAAATSPLTTEQGAVITDATGLPITVES